MKRSGLALALVFVVATLPLPLRGASIDEKIREHQRQVHNAHLKLNTKKHQLEGVRAKVGNLQGQLDQTNHNISLVSADLDRVTSDVHVNENRLVTNQAQLDAAQASLRRHNDAYRRRLVEAYEHGNLGYINVLLAANSFADFVERWDDIRYVVRANQDAIHARQGAQRKVAAARAQLLGTQVALEQARTEQQRRRNELDQLAQQRRNLLGAAVAEKASVAHQVNELEEISEQEESALEIVIRDKQRAEAARRAEERRAALLAGRPVPPSLAGPGAVGWPVSGTITSPFGMRFDPVQHRYQLHSGIDIAAAQGTTISAAADGRVIYASWYGGYGNAIIIDHGGGTSTLYGHCSQIFVGVGQDVQRGQAIGAVGMTGDATGPHVHFEVRRDGKPVDPLGYLH
ncbi:MAG TPA: peptidoglycan DD-metalloendopeptidase family protein [Candidatus Acidoferrales bacterium]|nr:peptidoglycan DD-metalloendopeptidase family protein [Candidatus Acidoferrales bacterium]